MLIMIGGIFRRSCRGRHVIRRSRHVFRRSCRHVFGGCRHVSVFGTECALGPIFRVLRTHNLARFFTSFFWVRRRVGGIRHKTNLLMLTKEMRGVLMKRCRVERYCEQQETIRGMSRGDSFMHSLMLYCDTEMSDKESETIAGESYNNIALHVFARLNRTAVIRPFLAGPRLPRPNLALIFGLHPPATTAPTTAPLHLPPFPPQTHPC